MKRSVRQRRSAWLTAGLGIAAFLPFVLVFVESSGRNNTPLVLEGNEAAEEGGLRMLSPSFTGRTPNGEPFVVTADWALPDAPKPNRIDLEGVEATLTLEDGRVATLLAAEGAFFPQVRRLRIESGVAVTTSDGYRLDTEAATVDAEARTLRTDGHVRATGPTGSIQADRLEALDADDRIVKFSGNVLLLIRPDRQPGNSAQQP